MKNFLSGLLYFMGVIIIVFIWGGMLCVSTLIVSTTDGLSFYDIVSSPTAIILWVVFIIVFISILALPLAIISYID